MIRSTVRLVVRLVLVVVLLFVVAKVTSVVGIGPGEHRPPPSGCGFYPDGTPVLVCEGVRP